jgi:Cu2+-exporting ATPase
MDVPVAIALLLAWLPSVVNTFRAEGEIYFDSVAMFIFFLSAGRFVEMSVRHRSLSSNEAMARSLPSQVTRLGPNGEKQKVAAGEIRAGDLILVPKGGVVAVDAQLPPDVREGTLALLDESLITGESAAVSRRAGELIRGGSLNLGAPLTLEARGAVSDSTLASIVALLERAQAAKPRIAQAADRVASWFVSGILVLSLVTAALWLVFDPSRAFAAVLAVLVITCPCALSLATPAALSASMLRLSRVGILVTRADAVERLARVDTVVLDKTGTLTAGAAQVVNVTMLGDMTRERALAIAAALERGSAHPLAAAFAAHEDPRCVAEGVREVDGQGVDGTVDGTRWRLGKRSYSGEIAGESNLLPLVRRDADDNGVFLASEAGIVACIEAASPLRATAKQAIDSMRLMGLDIIIASGDSDVAVRNVARALGVQHVRSRLSPGDKIRLVEQLRGQGHRVFMVGDGINDGPVLATADVSCAMGQGSAVAQSAADLLLLHEGLESLPVAIRNARMTLRVIRQNLAWAAGYNLAAVPLAAFGLVSPWLAALGMSLSSLGVVLNARRIAVRGDFA